MTLNYIRLLESLRGGFQKGIAGWRLRLTRPTKPPDTNRRPAQAQRRRAQLAPRLILMQTFSF
jgi:hypothetical protein